MVDLSKWFIAHFILSSVYIIYCQTLQKSVSVVLDSKWLDTPLHLEASEFLAEENSDFFWKFVNDCSKLEPDFFHQKPAKAQYDAIVDISSSYLSSTKIALLKFSLALRAYSPVVELFHQIAYDQQFPKHCEAVADVSGDYACDAEQLISLLSSSKNSSSLYQVDHSYPVSSQTANVVLYGEIGTSSFHEMNNLLLEKASKNEITYAVRHYVLKRRKRKVRLSGYGVELAVKSTEYKAQDDTKVKEERGPEQEEVDRYEELEGFIFSKLKDLHPSKKENLEKLKAHIFENSKEIPNLKVWELQELSLQAAQRILDSPIEETLRVMKDISQNFPTQARSLIHVSVANDLRKEIERNQQMFAHHHNIGPSDAALFINGMFFDMDMTDIFTLLQTLKQETRVLEALHKIKINEELLTKFLKMDFAHDKDEYAVDIRDSAIQYINNIEVDRPYRSWPGSVQDLLRPTYPGMLRSIKKNIYHLVIAADPSKGNARDIFKLAESFYVHKAPVRIGILFAVNPNFSVNGFQDAGVAFLNAYNFISQDKSPYDGLSFITDVYANTDDREISVENVITHFKSLYSNEDLDLIFGADSDYDTGRKLAWDFINRTGIGKPPQVLLNGVMLKQMQLTADMFEEAILTEIMRQTPFLQKSVYKGELTDSHNVLDFLMDQKNVMPRLNQRILNAEPSYIDLITENTETQEIMQSIKYFVKRDDDEFRPLTVWIVGDMDTEEGRALLSAGFAHLKTSLHMRLGIIHNPHVTQSASEIIRKSIQVSLDLLDRHTAKLFIAKLLKPANAKQVLNGEKSVIDFAISSMNSDDFTKKLEAFDEKILDLHKKFCKNILKLSPGERAVVINGRVIGSFEENEEFLQEDFHLLEVYSKNLYAEKIISEIRKSTNSLVLDSEMIMKVTSVLLAQLQPKVRYEIKFFSDKHSVINIPAADADEPAHEVIVIVDPVSKGAAKLSSMLVVLQRVINAHFKIFFNCVDKHSAMPLQSFYRFVLNEEPLFGSDGEFGIAPLAKFSSLPTTPLFTLGIITPENWLVEVVKSPYDLDNIHLEQVENSVHADFELEHLLIEGHCFEQSSGNPPRGLQFILGTNTSPMMVDTIVMANLGYFQLKANPGAWHLNLRQGRSSEIYEIVGSENTDTPPDSSDVVILISSFRSHIIKVKVSKRPGKQFEELLYDNSDGGNGIWSTITSTFTGNKSEQDGTENRINIFSLASGHLYERLLRIMMLSVLKNTKTPVKFWFLKNFLSPTFKDFLPFMARRYGFEYELVQYKWPRWLNQQSEKQRIIWGYKILFLDVLFPLDVKKIIFVDADQVVRADMKELNDLDLGGAPYGYTPFCDSRRDMDGYRFWKSGYWASHLAGRKYHISALYVVDLKKFRRVAAGDRLRGQYQGLSQDPNSLSNLDQDLPNNMIHQVNIKSLPQEWLWCETWCSDDTKQYAKTIDVCNNPKTKESKLASAMRIIPEWKDYDAEVKKVLQEYENQKKSSTADAQGKSTDSHDEL